MSPRPEHVLGRLYLTLFLRGSSARGISRSTAPTSVPSKLGWTLFIYFVLGATTAGWYGEPVLSLALALHAFTFLVLGTFVVASAGTMLFNPEENDILLHRPVTVRALLYAKIGTLVRVSLWLAAALNAVGLLVGLGARDGAWWFPLVHAASVALDALFVVGLVVLVYELCLRWFGRERLDALITGAQVLVAVGAVLVGQAPRLMKGVAGSQRLESVWVWVLPPAWFAGIDDALSGGGSGASWLGAGMALLATATVLWLAFGKLTASYHGGLQQLGESSKPPSESRGTLVRALVEGPLLRWWLSTPAARAAFLLCLTYLTRDRDTKVRVYPALASMVMLPAVMLVGFEELSSFSAFSVAFCGATIGLNAMFMTDLFRYSQHHRAADLFYQAPLASPEPLARGVRSAAMTLLVAPCAVATTLAVYWIAPSLLLLLVPGCLSAPAFARFANLSGPALPLSCPPEQAKAEGRTGVVMLAMLGAGVLSGLVSWSWHSGWFRELVLGELLLIVALCVVLEWRARAPKWPSLE